MTRRARGLLEEASMTVLITMLLMVASAAPAAT